MSETEQVIFEMLTENTGSAVYDSGGAYGRNHERNAKRTTSSFQEEPKALYEVYVPREAKSGASVSVTFSLFHWLVNRLEYDERLTKSLLAFGADGDDGWFGVVKNWLDKRDAVGPHGWSDSRLSVNTYNNGGSCLSQVIQYTAFSLPDSEDNYVALCVHGGCDVRGGYTAPKVFKIRGGIESLLDDDSYTLCGASDDVFSNWGRERGNWHEAQTPRGTRVLAKYGDRELEDFPVVADRGQKRRLGTIYVNEDKTSMTCPITGDKLKAYTYDE